MESSDDLYSQILQDGPSPKTLFHILSKLKEEGQLEKVIQESLKALNAYPDDIQIRQLLAETYFEAGLISEAEAELEKVTALIGELTDTYRLQAEIFIKEERNEEAAEALKIYLAHRPDDQDALDLLDSLRPAEETPAVEPEPSVEEIPARMEEEIEVEVSAAEEEEQPDIATPTLAEIYFDQGQIEEAIQTYEVVVVQNPEDERSKERLQELKAMKAEEKPVEDKEIDEARQKKEKMIVILESWLAKIRAQINPA